MENTIYLGDRIRHTRLNYTDLLEAYQYEVVGGGTAECYNLETTTSLGVMKVVGKLLYLPNARRAGLCFGGDSEWTDASSAQNAIDRYNQYEMSN